MMEFEDKENDNTERAKKICKRITEKLSYLFKLKRNNKNYPHRKLSELANVSSAVISDLETGKILPKMDNLIKLALALDINLTELLSEMNIEEKSINRPQHDSDLDNYLCDEGLGGHDIFAVKEFIEYLKWKKSVNK